jgi:tRNA threonylcarbamoyladenosine biosynthesis protein TsaE
MKIESLETIRKTAREFIETVIKQGSGRVFLFYGSMGAGKTTFIRAICEELGVEESVNSPTFAIVNEYRSSEGDPIYHFDFYRINQEEEAYDFGYEDYFYSGELCFVEWPEKIENLLPEDAVTVSITEQPDGTREVVVGEL